MFCCDEVEKNKRLERISHKCRTIVAKLRKYNDEERRMKTITKVIFIFIILSGLFVMAQQSNQEILTDIDGNTYQVVRIGDQVWMAENLRVTKDRDGNSMQSYCFDDDESNCEKLGRLYTWDVALKVSPDGWHLPSNEKWKALIDHLGGKSEAGKKLLEGGSSGFDALLAGAADFCGHEGRSDFYSPDQG